MDGTIPISECCSRPGENFFESRYLSLLQRAARIERGVCVTVKDSKQRGSTGPCFSERAIDGGDDGVRDDRRRGCGIFGASLLVYFENSREDGAEIGNVATMYGGY